MSKRNEEVVALFVEGDTEVEFYDALVKDLEKHSGKKFDFVTKCINMKGIGNFKSDALRELNRLQEKYPFAEISVLLCFDTDVFGLAKRPPVNIEEIKKVLLSNNAKQVLEVKAEKSIEDWFLLDLEGLLRYLRLPRTTNRGSGNGQEAIKKLFIKANKLYLKGHKCEGLIANLNIAKIRSKICINIKPLCGILHIDCEFVCGQNL